MQNNLLRFWLRLNWIYIRKNNIINNIVFLSTKMKKNISSFFNVLSKFHTFPLIDLYIYFVRYDLKVTQLCSTVCDLMDYTVHAILQVWILEWVAIPFSRVAPLAAEPPGSTLLDIHFRIFYLLMPMKWHYDLHFKFKLIIVT